MTSIFECYEGSRAEDGDSKFPQNHINLQVHMVSKT
jgi:hypothetical protein